MRSTVTVHDQGVGRRFEIRLTTCAQCRELDRAFHAVLWKRFEDNFVR